MNFATVYTAKADRASPRWVTINNEPSMTQEADANETDINVIMAKYQKTGQLPRQLMEPLFGDFTQPIDYAQAVTAIRSAEEAFLEIPAKIRAQFGNDPGEFIKFATNPDNKEELAKLGLLQPPASPTIEEQTLNAIKELKPKESTNGNTTGTTK